jgi:hypothetical protein
MQDLRETFTPEVKLESSIAYWGLPKEINEATDVLNWNMTRAGFSVDDPIRTLFLAEKILPALGDLYPDWQPDAFLPVLFMAHAYHHFNISISVLVVAQLPRNGLKRGFTRPS